MYSLTQFSFMDTLKKNLLLTLTVLVFIGCQPYGKEYKLDSKHNIYYKGEGLDEATAKKLAFYLKEQEYFQDDINSTVQIVKTKETKDTINLNFVVDKSKVSSDKEALFIVFGGMISKNVFNSAPLTVHLTDTHLKEFKNLGYAKATEEPTADKAEDSLSK